MSGTEIERHADWGGAVWAKGPDAQSFLQGQFTNDLGSLEEGAVAYGFWLNRKGKVLLDSYVLKAGPESFLLLSQHGSGEALFERLEPYIIMDEVELEVVGSGKSAIFLEEGSAADAASRLGLPLPSEGCFVASGLVFGFWIRKAKRRIFALVGLDLESVEWGRICALPTMEGARLAVEGWKVGIFEVGPDVWDGDLPQEAGLVEVGVSFRKGCYLGQEVMARLKAMGKVRRRMARVSLAGGELSPGTPIADSVGKKRGEIRRCLAAGGIWQASAMLDERAMGEELWVERMGGAREAIEILEGED